MLISVDSIKTPSCELVESVCTQCGVTLSECQEMCSSKRAQDYQLVNFFPGSFIPKCSNPILNHSSYMNSTGVSASALLYLKLSFTFISDLVK